MMRRARWSNDDSRF